MANFFDLYKRRMAIKGNSFSEKMEKNAKKVYDTYMKDAKIETAYINLNTYEVAMIIDKSDETLKQYIVLADKDSVFATGVVFEIDYVFYIILHEEETAHDQYFKGYAKKCTDNINIKTETGLYNYWVYVEGANKINMKRTEEGNIIIDDNQETGKVIMNKGEGFESIKPLQTRFFIGQDVYKVTGKSTLRDLGYLTVQSDDINTFRDNFAIGIANYYDEVTPEYNYYISAELVPDVVITKDTEYAISDILEIVIKDNLGNLVSKPYTIDVIATEINIDGSNITPLELGNHTIYFTLDDDKNSRATVVIDVVKEGTTVYDFTGEDTLIWSEESDYIITKTVGGTPTPAVWVFTIEQGDSLVDLVIIDDSSCTITAKEDIEVGDVVLLAKSGAEEVRKKIRIKAWW